MGQGSRVAVGLLMCSSVVRWADCVAFVSWANGCVGVSAMDIDMVYVPWHSCFSMHQG